MKNSLKRYQKLINKLFNTLLKKFIAHRNKSILVYGPRCKKVIACAAATN